MAKADIAYLAFRKEHSFISGIVRMVLCSLHYNLGWL